MMLSFLINVLLVLFAASTCVAAAEPSKKGLRGLGAEDDIGTHGGFDENLGQCTGAVCGLYGDPHIMTCDGLAYDCQGSGLFTLMKNHFYNIQGHFLRVGATEMIKVLGWGNYPKASSMNDIIIDVEDENVPTFQFTFPDLSAHDGLVPSEEGCLIGLHYEPFDFDGHERSVETSVQGCKQRCENTDGCVKFSYWMDGGCHLQDDTSNLVTTPSDWTRSISGPVHECGNELSRTQTTTEFPFAKVFTSNASRSCYDMFATDEGGTWRCGERIAWAQSNHEGFDEADACNLIKSEFPDKCDCDCEGLNDDSQREDFGNNCPFLFYSDGEIVDISQVPDGGYLYGHDESSDSSAKLEGENKIRIRHKTTTGSYSEAILEVAGNGPGELFGCHWNFWVCLPQDQEDLFSTETVGLLGSPDGDAHNDWMDSNGEILTIPHDGKRSKAAFDYCHENWCVSQDESIMTYPSGTTYADHKCFDEEYVEFDVHFEGCVISADKIIEFCADKPIAMITPCQIDCCYGGCNQIDHVEEELVELQTFSVEVEEEDLMYDAPIDPAPLCDEESGEKSRTGKSVCPTSGSDRIVEIKHRSSDDELPIGDQDILYGIVLEGRKDENVGTSIKFKVDNIFDTEADIFVSYEKKVGIYGNQPMCESMLNTKSGCDVDAKSIEVGCIEFPGKAPFALVNLYFVSNNPTSFIKQNAKDDRAVHKCCPTPDLYNADDTYGVVKYTLEIQCTCPNDEHEVNMD